MLWHLFPRNLLPTTLTRVERAYLQVYFNLRVQYSTIALKARLIRAAIDVLLHLHVIEPLAAERAAPDSTTCNMLQPLILRNSKFSTMSARPEAAFRIVLSFFFSWAFATSIAFPMVSMTLFRMLCSGHP